MIVSCQSCKTKFNLDETRLKAPKTRVRCSKCGHVFEVAKPVGDDEVFIRLDPFEDRAPDVEDEGPFGDMPPPPPPPPASSRAPARARRGTALKKIVVTLVVLALLGGGGYAAWRYLSAPGGEPQTAATPAGKTPPPVKEPAAKAATPVVKFLDDKAYFLENRTAGQIFVVEGEVRNEEDRPISFVLLEGRLLATDNQPVQAQRSFAGNVMTRDELTQLSVTDIQNRMMNREGKDLRNVHVPPQGKVPFMVVFHNLPEIERLGDYEVVVVSAQFEKAAPAVPEKGQKN